jgi:hypothetical protein
MIGASTFTGTLCKNAFNKVTGSGHTVANTTKTIPLIFLFFVSIVIFLDFETAKK